jgi:hypothetical protein
LSTVPALEVTGDGAAGEHYVKEIIAAGQGDVTHRASADYRGGVLLDEAAGFESMIGR